MSRAAFFDIITTDPELNSIGINDDTVFHNYSNEERPSDTTPFIILRWGVQQRPRWADPDFVVKSPENLTLWVHWPRELTNDYTKLNKILDRIDEVSRNVSDMPGSDGYTLSFVHIGDRSGDFLDSGFHTIAKNAAYEVHSRKS